MNEVITKFFDERKEAWLKKNLKSSLSEEEVLRVHEICSETFSLEIWLPHAAQRAGQISMSTHPCTFSHPSSRKNGNGYVTSIIAETEHRADGFLRSGNVAVQSDALGNAAALDVHKFLSLQMPDGLQLIEHIKNESDLARSLLKIKTKSYEALRNGFLEMIVSSKESVTSSKIKQVYFPVNDDYHQLSLLSNSGMIYHLKKRLDEIRFGDKLKVLREKRKNNEFSEDSFSEIYNLTTIGYGGTKPQNISVLNSQNGGKAQLLYSMPPVIEDQNIRFPKYNFFNESIKGWEQKEIFYALHHIYKTDYNNKNIREGRAYRYQQLLDRIIEKMWAVRAVSQKQYFEKSSKLKSYQKLWLSHAYEEQKEGTDVWLEKLVKEITSWIIRTYEKQIGKQAIKFGEGERQMVLDVVKENKEALR